MYPERESENQRLRKQLFLGACYNAGIRHLKTDRLPNRQAINILTGDDNQVEGTVELLVHYLGEEKGFLFDMDLKFNVDYDNIAKLLSHFGLDVHGVIRRLLESKVQRDNSGLVLDDLNMVLDNSDMFQPAKIEVDFIPEDKGYDESYTFVLKLYRQPVSYLENLIIEKRIYFD